MADHRRRRAYADCTMKPRIALAMVAALVYGGWRVLPKIASIVPGVAVVSRAPFEQIGKLSSGMSSGDRAAMRDAYDTLARAVAADPDEDPVFVDVAAVRRAHRAALLVVWRGALDNKAGEVPGLREALEGALSSRIGADDVPLNPALRAETAKAFNDISASFR